MVGRYREQRLCKLADVLNEKVLNILTGENYRGLFFTNTLHKIPDIFHSSQIGEEQVKFVDTRNGISRGQQLVGHIRKHVEQQGGADIFARLQKSLYAEGHKIAVGNICVTVEKFAFRALAYGVQTEAYVLQCFVGVKIFFFRVIFPILTFNKVVKIRENGVIGRSHFAPIGAVGYAEFVVQLNEKQFDRVYLPIGKILVAVEKVTQKADVL